MAAPAQSKGDSEMSSVCIDKDVRQEAGAGAAGKGPRDRDRLIVDNLPLVEILARRIGRRLPPSVEIEDLIGAGTVGLVQAAGDYRPDSGVLFRPYATHRIRGAIYDGLREWDPATRLARRRIKQVSAWYAEAEQRLGRPPCDASMMEFLGLNSEQFQRLLREAAPVALVSFEDLRKGADPDSDAFTADDLADSSQLSPEERASRQELYRIVADAIDELPDRIQLLLSLYYFDELTMKEIASILGVTECRVSQLHKAALLKLRKKLTRVLERV